MPIKTVIAGGVSILGVMALPSAALANGCFSGQAGPNCNPGTVVVTPYTPQQAGPVTIRNTAPLGHLRSVNFQRSPNVSITRVHGLAPNVALNDAPSEFTGGCTPSSTVYCRAGNGAAAPIAQVAPQAPVQFIPAPVAAAPVEPLRTWIGGGYDPSKFIPRQYGENTFTPGIAHIPTSIVDRNPANADQVLQSGRTVAQPLAGNGGFAPRVAQPVAAPLVSAPQIQPSFGPNVEFIQGPLVAGPVIAGPVTSAPAQFAQPTYAQPVINQGYRAPGKPVLTGNGTYASTVGSDGTYWEKTSGLTTVGGSVATEVLCKRTLPTQVVNPVIGVPTPVCQSAGHGLHPAHGDQPVGGLEFIPTPTSVGNARYGAPAPSGPWTF